MSGADTDRRRFEALRHCLTASPDTAAPRDLAAWCRDWRARVESEPAPVAQAILGGFAADRVGWAFAAGYQAALRQLLAGFNEQPAADARLALCATESGGNRPRDIATVLRRDGDGWRLDGAKSWITLGEAATELLVVARLDEGGDRPALKVARVPAGAAGVTLENKAPLEFVPEIPHTAARFESVAVPGDGLLDGDGYDTVVKPFRTIEDTFIALAVQAWLLREARARRWPAPRDRGRSPSSRQEGSLSRSLNRAQWRVRLFPGCLLPLLTPKRWLASRSERRSFRCRSRRRFSRSARSAALWYPPPSPPPPSPLPSPLLRRGPS